jgi:hypothetical protein
MSNLQQLVQTYYQAFNARNFNAYAELFAPDCVVEAPGVSLSGLEGMRAFDHGWLEAFPNAHIEAFRMTTVGDQLVTGNWFHGGEQLGILRTPGGDIPPTKAVFEAPYCARFQIQNGKIKLQRLLYELDFLPLKLGLV